MNKIFISKGSVLYMVLAHLWKKCHTVKITVIVGGPEDEGNRFP
jgi:hypothetical protein